MASRLLCGASTFFFLAFLFAYFYLRSLNVAHMWRPAHVNPSQGLGAAFIACVVVSAALTIVAGRQMKSRSRGWTGPAIGGVVLGLAAVALQCVEYTRQNFGPTNGAFASVFCAWTAFYLIAVLFTMYWLETQVATELRARSAPAQQRGRHQGSGSPDRPGAGRRRLLLGLPCRDRGDHLRGPLPALVLATAAATPGFWDWSFDPPLVLVIDLAVLYWIGDRRTVTPQRKRIAQRWRSACFYSALVVLAIALASPIERLSAQLFWVHMIQHVLLLDGRRAAVRRGATVDPPVALSAA